MNQIDPICTALFRSVRTHIKFQVMHCYKSYIKHIEGNKILNQHDTGSQIKENGIKKYRTKD